MKFYVYFLSFLLTFAPIYAHAFVPAGTALAGSTAGRVVITKGTELFLRMVSPTALAKIGKGAIAICAKNLTACAVTGAIAAMKKDGWTINIKNETTNNDIDVEIYRNIEDKCFIDFYLQEFSSSTNTTRYDVSSYSTYLVERANLNNPYKYNYTVDTSEPYSQISDIKETLRAQGIKNTNYVKYPNPIRFPLKAAASNGWTSTEYRGADFYYRCLAVSQKTYMEDSQINNYFIKNVSDDDITNIYNYDYSKHQTIKINNNVEYGDTINNYKNDIDINNTDKKVTQNVVDKSKAKNPDYHPDKIDDTNCDKDDTGAYDKCGSDRDKDDDTASTPASTPTPTDPPKDDDDPPLECNTSGFTREICEFVDEVEDFLELPNDTDSKLSDTDDDVNPVSTDVKFSDGCPSNYDIEFDFLGRHIKFALFDSAKFCGFLSTFIKPSLIAVSAIWAIWILRGQSV